MVTVIENVKVKGKECNIVIEDGRIKSVGKRTRSVKRTSAAAAPPPCAADSPPWRACPTRARS